MRNTPEIDSSGKKPCLRLPVPAKVSQPVYSNIRPDHRAALRTPNVQVHLGEQATSYNTHNPPKPIDFSSETSLMTQLWHNYIYGEGQPIQLYMRDLEFNNHLNAGKLLSDMGILPYLRQDVINKRALERKLDGPVEVHGNEKVTHIFLKEDITQVSLNFEYSPAEFAAFGDLAVNMSNVHIMVSHDQGNTIDVYADLKPANKKGNELDNFDFNPREWGKRPEYAKVITRFIHHALPSGTSFKVYSKGVNKFHQRL